MKKDAIIDDTGLYRYWLARRWDERCTSLGFLMLNPSTADADQDDPTIRRCIGFAKAAGYGGIQVVNLFALRATNPADMWDSREAGINIVGWENDHYIEMVAGRVDRLVLAWGANVEHRYARERVTEVLEKAREWNPHCLGLTKKGEPRHPLMVRADQPVEEYHYRTGILGPATRPARLAQG